MLRKLFLSVCLAAVLALASCGPKEDPTGPVKPDTEQPGDNTGTDDPGTDQPGTDQPGADQPGTDQPGTDDPLAGVGKDYKDFDIYLAIGQSNMAGRGPLDAADRDSITGVWILNPAGEPEKATNPMNKYSTVRKDDASQKMSPAYGFCTSIYEKTKRPILMVVNARGGTGISEWAEGRDLFNEAVARTKAALPYGTLKGIIWHQGESNASSWKSYMAALKAMVAALRTQIGAGDVPFIAGEIQHDHSNAGYFNYMIHTISDEIPASGWLSAYGVTLIEDNLHHDRASQVMLGGRYAEAVYAMVYADPKATSFGQPDFPDLYASAKEVAVGYEAGASVSVETMTNQSSVSASVPAAAATWLKAEVQDGKVVFTSLQANEGDDARTAKVTISAGSESLTVSVTQRIPSKYKTGTVWGTEGVVFWVNPDDPNEMKIVSAKAEKRPWGPAGVTIQPNNVNSSTLSGEEACARIKGSADYAKASYAQQFCDGLGDGWRLPTRSEGDDLFFAYDGETFFAKDKSGTATQKVPNECTEAEKAARTAFENALLSLPDGVKLNPADWSANGDSIWLCMETSKGDGYYYRYGFPGCSTGAKSSTSRWARCVKVVKAE
ncbi:MAG: hypothetical protein IJ799_01275 [Bacteroidales bacterium]|nr:hypothetical protein [Bacteroidales bacterium]